VSPRRVHVAGGSHGCVNALLIRDWTSDSARASDNQRGRGNKEAFRHEGAGRYDRTLSDVRAVEDCRTHSDEGVVSNCASVKNGSVSHGHVVTYVDGEAGIGVNRHVVLQVRSVSHRYRRQVGTEYGAVPNRLFTDEGVVGV
jgi:hypothetical protein